MRTIPVHPKRIVAIITKHPKSLRPPVLFQPIVNSPPNCLAVTTSLTINMINNKELKSTLVATGTLSAIGFDNFSA
jgi:hypothetical protein